MTKHCKVFTIKKKKRIPGDLKVEQSSQHGDTAASGLHVVKTELISKVTAQS